MSSLPTLSALTPTDRIVEEMVVGMFPHSEIQTTAALEIACKESLLRGTSLTIRKPGGAAVIGQTPVQQVATELCAGLGGWFCANLTSYLEFYDDLLSESFREQYRKSGLNLPPRGTDELFYYLAFSVPPWQVQAVGVARDFCAIFLARLLARSQAVGNGGHIICQPIGVIEPVLIEAVPNINLERLADVTPEHAVNVFDNYFIGDGLVVKAGVRVRLGKDSAAYRGKDAYFYGIRINVDLALLD